MYIIYYAYESWWNSIEISWKLNKEKTNLFPLLCIICTQFKTNLLFDILSHSFIIKTKQQNIICIQSRRKEKKNQMRLPYSEEYNIVAVAFGICVRVEWVFSSSLPKKRETINFYWSYSWITFIINLKKKNENIRTIRFIIEEQFFRANRNRDRERER